ncbi:hypothetical protein ACFLQU_04940 [Verrucomicrobiota bacterium]
MMKATGEETGLGTWLFNPFTRIRGWEALLYGLLVITLTGYVGATSNTHFDGVLDTHTGMPAPWWMFLAEGLIDWLSLAGTLWVFGRLASRGSVRNLDLFGTQALARWPMFIAAVVCMSDGYTRFTESLTKRLTGAGKGAPIVTEDAVVFGVVIAVMLVAMCWMVYLMYRSYAMACNVRGGRGIGTFIAGLLVAEIMSKILIVGMFIACLHGGQWNAPAGNAPKPESESGTFQHEKVYAFDSDEGIETINRDPGLAVLVENGELRVHGKTTDKKWEPDAVQVAVTDAGGAVDVSGSFRIKKAEASGLVFIEAATRDGGPLIYMYQWLPVFGNVSALGTYQVQTHWFKIPADMVHGVHSMRRPEDPGKGPCTMRIHVHADHKTVDFYANGVFQDTVVFEKSFGPIVSAKMELQTPAKNKQFDVRFDDLRIRWNEEP